MLGLVQDLACMYTYMCVHVHQILCMRTNLVQPVATLQSNREEYSNREDAMCHATQMCGQCLHREFGSSMYT